jgi:hypothetical protein
MPTTLENVAGYDLTRLEIKIVEDKREAVFKKKATLTPAAAAEEARKDGESEGDDGDDDGDGDEDAESKEVKDASDAAAAPTKTESSAPVDPATTVHEGVSCDECHMSPLVGIRYKCAK